MTTRITILGLLLVLLGCVTAGAEHVWSVRLSDGVTHDGVLVRIEPGRYLLQTEGQLLELTDDDIDPVTFRDHPRTEAAPARPLVETRFYDELHPDGKVIMHWDLRVENTTSEAITELRWGLAPWERGHVDQRRYRDAFGNVLEPTYDPPREQWAGAPDQRVQVTVPLPVPVAPGETMIVNAAETASYVQRTAEGLRYVNPGDYPEDRLVWRKVRLPRGARIEKISPEPTARFTHEGHEYVMWRRFYKAGEVMPLGVLYTLD